jgi:hypothetical protein
MAGRALARIVDQSLGMALNHRVPGSSLGATTIQSSKTVETVFDWKQAVSAGIFDGLVRLFRSLKTLAVSQAYF